MPLNTPTSRMGQSLLPIEAEWRLRALEEQMTVSPASLPFDFKAYKGTASLITPVGIPSLMLDEDVTWCSQWGKVVDLTFRFYTGSQPSDTQVPAHMQWATVTGIGITMSGYRQPMTMLTGPLGGIETDGQLYPFELIMIDDSDFTQGYVLENMMNFSLQTGKSYFFKGNEQLITRTYFKDGELTYSPEDFS